MRYISHRALFVLLCGGALALGVTSRAHALEVTLSCPEYAPGQGNDPAQGALSQPGVLGYDVHEELACQVYYSNTSGALQGDVTFTLKLPTRMERALVSDPLVLPEGDPRLAALGDVGRFGVPDRFAEQVHAAPGYLPGVYDESAGEYSWSLGDLAVGQSGQLRLEMRALAGISGVVEHIELVGSTTQLGALATRSVAVTYQGGLAEYALYGVAPERVDGLLGRVGAKHLLRREQPGRAHADGLWTLDLPYWDGVSARVDGGYDPMNPTHHPLIDPTGLRARVVLDGALLIGELEPGRLSGPVSGPNADQIVRYDAIAHRLTVRLGSIEEQAEVSWSAPLDLMLMPGEMIPHRSCYSAASVAPQCGTVASQTVGAEDPATLEMNFQGVSYSPLGAIATNGVIEPSALSFAVKAFRTLLGLGHLGTRSLKDYDVVTQAPGDAQRQATFVSASWPEGLYQEAFATGERAIYVSTQPSSYGSAGDLSARVLQGALGASWVRCDDALGAPGRFCTEAHLSALNLSAEQVTEVRFKADWLPARHESGFDPLDAERATTQAEVLWTMRDSVVDSIDGLGGSYNPNTLTRRSFGGVTRLEYTLGVEDYLLVTPRSAEVTRQDIDALWRVSGLGALGWIAPSEQVRPGAPAYLGVRLFNEGAQANVFGPVRLTMTLPQGFDVDSGQFFPTDTLQPRVRAGRSDGQSGTLWSWNDPNHVSSSYTFDPLTRRYSVELETSHPQGALSPIRRVEAPQGQVGDLIVLIHGRALVQAPDHLEVIDAELEFDAVLDGARAPQRVALQAASFWLTPREPDVDVSLSAPSLIGAQQTFRYLGEVTNDAYEPSGVIRPQGATAPAEQVMVFVPITRAGDHPAVEGGGAQAELVEAASSHASSIWVSDSPTPPRPDAASFGLTAPPPPSWHLCASGAQACDLPALAQTGLSAGQVRWVALSFGHVALTDVEPRGVEARRGVARQQRPYPFYVDVREDGTSADGATLRARATVVAAAVAPRDSAHVDVAIDTSCDASHPFVGFGEPERCDGLDNNCDGLIDEGFGLGGACMAQFYSCQLPGQLACNNSGQTYCDVSALDDVDQDNTPDLCDCAPLDGAHAALQPGAPGSCDGDADGECSAAMIGPAHQMACPDGTSDCDDRNPLRRSSALELCDDQDNDCDGLIDEDYPQVGQPCGAGVGACYATGQLFCGGDGFSVTCDAIPSSPVAEACDGLDNDCDGQIDEDYTRLGEFCTAGAGACQRPGEQVCHPGGNGVVCDAVSGPSEAEACNGVDDDCDGQIDEGFGVDTRCVVTFPGGCEAEGVGACTADGLGQVCLMLEPDDTDGDGVPDVCDCAPLDPWLDSLEPLSDRSCDHDGDGRCNARLSDLNEALCDEPLDCNDARAEVYPGALERCDGFDNDCDGQIDEDFFGLGDSCEAGEGACLNIGVLACDDAQVGVACTAVAGVPGSQERCDGSDNNCDGQIDEGFEQLGQSCPVSDDVCAMPGVFACSVEDQHTVRCVVQGGLHDEDADGTPDACDCAPFEPTRGLLKSCDEDADGWCDERVREPNEALCPQTGDCRDNEPEIHPGAEERCDEQDNDCDEQIDEDFIDLGQVCEGGQGACYAQGAMVCDEAGLMTRCSAETLAPSEERCDGVDNDCDGQIDEDFSGLGDSCEAGEGACANTGALVCDEAQGGVRCTAMAGVPGSQERCDGFDNNCDGQIDEGFEQLGQACEVGQGACRVEGAWSCDEASGQARCEANEERPEPSKERCDGVDNDCDGQIDEALPGCEATPQDPSEEEERPEPPDYAVFGTGICAATAPSTPARTGALPLWLIALALCGLGGARRRRQTRRARRRLAATAASAALAAAWLTAPLDASAQQRNPLKGSSLSTQQLRPMPGGAAESLGAVSGARVLEPGALSFGVLSHYGYRPLVLIDRTSEEVTDVVRHQLQSELMASFGLTRALELSATMPILIQQRGEELPGGGALATQGPGDARLRLRAGRALSERFGLFGSLHMQLSLPTGAQAAGQSDGGVRAEPGAALSVVRPGGALLFNLAYAWRGPEGTLNAAAGHTVRWGVGASKRFGSSPVEGFIEAFGSAAAAQPAEARDISDFPAEALGGVRLWRRRVHLFSLSAGPGLTRGYGTPTARFVAGYRYVPAREDDSLLGPHDDADLDGILNREDACIDLREDFDGFEDEDGCPDEDNDQDGLLDVVDACPNRAEDLDGFEDEDGCPDEDNDQDGLLDERDRCADSPEDFDGFEDEDGCPDLDNDLDGILDDEDACHDEAEDFDGFEDEDGCPDEDNDRDSILDVVDLCPNDQEIFNEFEDEDGCPDEVDGDLIAWTTERILLGEEIYFDTDRAKIQERSRPVLRALAEFLEAHPEIELVEIQGHTDDRGTQEWNMDLSWRRAQNVRRYLRRRGIDPKRLVLRGYGKLRPFGSERDEASRARNRRVEFRILRLVPALDESEESEQE